jgi:hypothetical protein
MKRLKRENRIQYYAGAAEFWRKAAAIQSDRCLQNGSDPALARVDLNFYVVAVQRLRGVAEQARDRLGLADVRRFLDEFDKRWPRFIELRNLEEHTTGPTGGNPLGIWYFRGVVADCQPQGRAESLVHVVDMDPSVERLFQGLYGLLREELVTLSNRSRKRPNDAAGDGQERTAPERPSR